MEPKKPKKKEKCIVCGLHPVWRSWATCKSPVCARVRRMEMSRAKADQEGREGQKINNFSARTIRLRASSRNERRRAVLLYTAYRLKGWSKLEALTVTAKILRKSSHEVALMMRDERNERAGVEKKNDIYPEVIEEYRIARALEGGASWKDHIRDQDAADDPA